MDQTVNCNDGNACTVDSCDPSTGCVHTPADCGTSSDACITISCDPSKGCVHTPVSCDDGLLCTVDSCDPSSGCVYTPMNCDDRNACTSDSCNATLGCVHTPITCNDNNLCTLDSCDPLVGCVFTPITCNDNNACTIDSCDPTIGCTTQPVNCDDGDHCTTDTCDPSKGCVHTWVCGNVTDCSEFVDVEVEIPLADMCGECQAPSSGSDGDCATTMLVNVRIPAHQFCTAECDAEASCADEYTELKVRIPVEDVFGSDYCLPTINAT